MEPRCVSQIDSGKFQNQTKNTVQNQTDRVQNYLHQILQKLPNLDNRLTRLEYSDKGAIPKKRNA